MSRLQAFITQSNGGWWNIIAKNLDGEWAVYDQSLTEIFAAINIMRINNLEPCYDEPPLEEWMEEDMPQEVMEEFHPEILQSYDDPTEAQLEELLNRLKEIGYVPEDEYSQYVHHLFVQYPDYKGL